MSNTAMVAILLTALGGLITTLTAVVGWIGIRIHNRLDDIASSLKSIEADLREDINKHSSQIAVLNSRCNLTHDRRQGDFFDDSSSLNRTGK